jgi:hypothetical protein
MWWNPSRLCFLSSQNAGISGLGLLIGMEMLEMENRKEELVRYAKEFREGMVPTYLVILSHSWTRLRTLPAKYKEKCLEVMEFQCNWLEL